MILPNLMRGLAGLMLGCFIYSISEIYELNDWYKRKSIWILKIIEIFLLMFVFGWIMQKHAFSEWDFVEIICFVFLLLISTFFPMEFKNRKIGDLIKFLGKLSLPMYLFQSVPGYVMKIFDVNGMKDFKVRSFVFWSILIALSIMSLYLRHLKEQL